MHTATDIIIVMLGDFEFHPRLDSPNWDLSFSGRKPVEELMRICLDNPKYVGFNTLGFMKGYIGPIAELKVSPFFTPKDGLYVHRSRYLAMHGSRLEFPEWEFIANCRLRDTFKTRRNPKLLECDFMDVDEAVRAFDIYGNTSMEPDPPIKEEPLSNYNLQIGESMGIGTYVRRRTIRIGFMEGKGARSRSFLATAVPSHMRNQLEVAGKDKPVDYTVSLPSFSRGRYSLLRGRDVVHRGIGATWRFGTGYADLKARPIVKRRHLTNTLCITWSGKRSDPVMSDFLRFLEKRGIAIDVYGKSDPGFGRYRGSSGKREDGYFDYRYCIALEVEPDPQFASSKLWEPIIAECLCFYWGRPEHVDPMVFMPVDPRNFEQGYRIISQALENDEWSRRIESILREKTKLMDHYGLMPNIKSAVDRHQRLYDGEWIYKSWLLDDGGKNGTVCFVHSCTMNGDTSILKELIDGIAASGLATKLDRLFVVNIGDAIDGDPIFGDLASKASLLNLDPQVTLYEIPTVNLLLHYAERHDSNILYLHTKGVTRRNDQIVNYWRRLMCHFVVDKWRECLRFLEVYDAVGINLCRQRGRIFGGNFWWSKSGYLKYLTPITNQFDRFTAETLLLSDENAFPVSLYDPDIYRYQHPYPLDVKITPALPVMPKNCVVFLGNRPTDLDVTVTFTESPDTDHLLLWKRLIEGDNDSCLILEEGVKLSNDFAYRFQRTLAMLSTKTDWDLAFLGYDGDPDVDSSPGLNRLIPMDKDGYAGGQWAYLVSRSGAAKLAGLATANGTVDVEVEAEEENSGDATVDLYELICDSDLNIWESRPHLAVR